MVERTAIESGEYAHCRDWNSYTFLSSQELFGGEIRLPDAVVLLHTKEGTKYNDHPVIVDAAKLNIPTIGIVDSDCNPNLITYPIPGKDIATLFLIFLVFRNLKFYNLVIIFLILSVDF